MSLVLLKTTKNQYFINKLLYQQFRCFLTITFEPKMVESQLKVQKTRIIA